MIRTLSELIRHRVPVAMSVSTDCNVPPEANVMYAGDNQEVLQLINDFNEKFEEDRSAGARLIWDISKNWL